MRYEWDSEKARSNRLKHGVAFGDAVGVLEDVLGITLRESSASSESRLVTMGMDYLGRILVVVYAWRDDRVRIISARRATRNERHWYEDKR